MINTGTTTRAELEAPIVLKRYKPPGKTRQEESVNCYECTLTGTFRIIYDPFTNKKKHCGAAAWIELIEGEVSNVIEVISEDSAQPTQDIAGESEVSGSCELAAPVDVSLPQQQPCEERSCELVAHDLEASLPQLESSPEPEPARCGSRPKAEQAEPGASIPTAKLTVRWQLLCVKLLLENIEAILRSGTKQVGKRRT